MMMNFNSQSRPNLLLGFHGCDQFARDQLVTEPNNVRQSREDFDWLGHGFYVWENNYERALLWAEDKMKRGTLTKPSVVGIIYQLNYCLDFTDSAFIKLVSESYTLMKQEHLILDRVLPQNKNAKKDQHHDLILCYLDCAVIEYLHQQTEN